MEKFALHLGSDTRHQTRTKQGLDPKLLRYPQMNASRCSGLNGVPKLRIIFWLSSSSRIDIDRRLLGALGRADLPCSLA